MNYSNNDWRDYQELYHHGILGMHWGIRRYQNYDGSLTDAGRAHLGIKSSRGSQGYSRNIEKLIFSKTENPMAAIEYNARKLGGDPEDYKERFRKSIVHELQGRFSQAQYDNYGFEETCKTIKPVIDEIQKNERVQKAVGNLKTVNKEYANFHSSENEELRNKYYTLAGLVDYELNGSGKYGTREDHVYGYKNEDFDQGTGNSFSLYLLDKGIDGNKYDSNNWEAHKQYTNALKDAISDYMGDSANIKLEDKKSGRTTTISHILSNNIDNKLSEESNYTFDGPSDECGFGKDTEVWKRALEEAKREYARNKSKYDSI